MDPELANDLSLLYKQLMLLVAAPLPEEEVACDTHLGEIEALLYEMRQSISDTWSARAVVRRSRSTPSVRVKPTIESLLF